MPPISDPSAPPAYVINTLNSAGFEPWAVDGEPDQWRMPGQPAKPWRQCMEFVGDDYGRMRRDNAALVKANAALTEKVAALVAATPKSGFLSSRFVVTMLTAVPMVAGAVFMVLQDMAGELFPAPWGKVIGAVAAILVAGMAKNYSVGRAQIEAQSTTAKKSLTESAVHKIEEKK